MNKQTNFIANWSMVISIVLKITYIYSLLAIKITKCFEIFFTILLTISNNKNLDIICKNLYTKSGDKINILFAKTENGTDVCNKLKLFCSWYWKNHCDDLYTENGFDISKLCSMLNCSVLYITYIISNNDNEIDPENFYNKIKHVLLVRDINTNKQIRFYNASKKEDVFINHFTF